jgi:hypothetical protein
MFDYDARPVTPGVILVGTIGAEPGQGQPVMMGAVAAEQRGLAPGDEVIGFSDKRASQAELVLVEAGDLTRKPEKVSWEAAGGLFVAGTTADRERLPAGAGPRGLHRARTPPHPRQDRPQTLGVLPASGASAMRQKL